MPWRRSCVIAASRYLLSNSQTHAPAAIFLFLETQVLMPSHAIVRVTHANLRCLYAQVVNRRAFSLITPVRSSCVQGASRRGGPLDASYLPEVAVQSMYSKMSPLRRASSFGPNTIARRFASDMSVHRSKYAAVVVGGGPAGITV